MRMGKFAYNMGIKAIDDINSCILLGFNAKQKEAVKPLLCI
jgi:hypothetical protein